MTSTTVKNTFNKKIADHLIDYMPVSFIERCPVCKNNWDEHVVDDKIEITCLACYNKDAKTTSPGWIWKRIAKATVNEENYADAWIELWWNTCYCYGLVRAIGLSNGKKD